MAYQSAAAWVGGNRMVLAFGFATLWAVAWWMTPQPLAVIESHGHFFGLGLIGAIVANSTGSGGGVVFIPAFTTMGITPLQALGTSIAIQCFGMTAGSLSWLIAFARQREHSPHHLGLLGQVLVYVIPASLVGMLTGQFLIPVEPSAIAPVFRGFSVAFGLILIYATLVHHKESHAHHRLRRNDRWLVIVVGLVGGLVTSWISVGVGELLALLMIFRRYPTMVAVAAAVCVSSATVIAGVWWHLWIGDSVVWEVLLFAVPAAVIGGSVARLLAERMGAARLKIFFATWILVTGLVFG